MSELNPLDSIKIERAVQVIMGIAAIASLLAPLFVPVEIPYLNLLPAGLSALVIVRLEFSIAASRRALRDPREAERQIVEAKNERERGLAVFWGLLVFISVTAAFMLRELSNTAPVSSYTVANSNYLMLAAGFVVLFLIRIKPQAVTLPGAIWRGILAHTSLFLLVFCITAGTFPSVIAGVATSLGLQLFVTSCDAPQVRDVAWLVLDNLAKGALLDVMESFHIDIHTCPPNPRSWAASTIVFSIRLISTFGLVWYIGHLWKLYSQWLLGSTGA